MQPDKKGVVCEAGNQFFQYTDKDGVSLTFSVDCGFGFTITDEQNDDEISVCSPDEDWSYEYLAVLAAVLLSGFHPDDQRTILDTANALNDGVIDRITASGLKHTLDLNYQLRGNSDGLQA